MSLPTDAAQMARDNLQTGTGNVGATPTNPFFNKN